MSKRRIIAVMLSLVGSLTVLGSPPARAATVQCGAQCIEIFSPAFGTHDHPTFVETVFDGIAWVGQPTIMQRASGFDPSADLMVPHAGLRVSDFFKQGMVSAEVNRYYGTEHATQLEYAPFGQPSGLCAGLATTAFQNEGLTLQPCSVPATTVWIIDGADAPATGASHYFPLVSGSTTDVTHPFGMTFPDDAYACFEWLPQIRVRHLIGNPAHVPDRQLWGTHIGVLP